VGALKILLGATLLVAGLLLTLPLPEFGIPLMLVGLRLLGERYAWARLANAWLDAQWRKLRTCFHGLSPLARVIILAALVGLAVSLVWVTASHI
jgi:hypothetical protein